MVVLAVVVVFNVGGSRGGGVGCGGGLVVVVEEITATKLNITITTKTINTNITKHSNI